MNEFDTDINNKIYDFFKPFDFLKKTDIDSIISMMQIKKLKKNELLSDKE